MASHAFSGSSAYVESADSYQNRVFKSLLRLIAPSPRSLSTATLQKKNDMTYCTTCGHQIQATACLQCGTVRRPFPFIGAAPHTTEPPASLSLPLAALVCGLLSAAMLRTPHPWSALQATGAGITMTAAIALGCIAVARHERGQIWAITGVLLGAMGVMCGITVHL